MENNELRHWGIKGMKWGQRRYQNKDGTLTPAGKARYANNEPQHEDYVKARSKQVSTMSDKELNDAVIRLQREQLYSKLTTPEETRGQKFVSKALDKIGDKVIEKAVNKIGDSIIDKSLDAIGRKTKADIGRSAKGRDFLRKWGYLKRYKPANPSK